VNGGQKQNLVGGEGEREGRRKRDGGTSLHVQWCEKQFQKEGGGRRRREGGRANLIYRF
jgi:hypothetical protein